MMNFNMKYYNVYYYCNIISAVIEKGGIDFARTLGEFMDNLWNVQPENFPKCSMLHQFCEWAIERIFYEEMTSEVSEIRDLFEGYEETSNFSESLKKAFYTDSDWNEKEPSYKFLRIEDAIFKYKHKRVRFLDWLEAHQEHNFTDDAFAEYIEYLCYEGLYYETISDIANEVFYILFQNREFLLAFNLFISDQNPYETPRVAMPQWVKRAVNFRDRGKCVCCGKDLSGEFDVIENGMVHFDHIIPLEQSGLNDVVNLQLMCAECNHQKATKAFTTQNYRNWYDITL